ncbi:RidA family protein [Sphingomonas sp. So64.6b]|uniref:RidA family protein n=1 Tax=Sphingomonas sp. So64.6b TaxID=2997354 RepID=UPI0016042E11|nr:RidA family protein [Sphingomonas sp. So64.6b]QNA85514.1 RidA family protein [Sphingomonas sp. So64.6b]
MPQISALVEARGHRLPQVKQGATSFLLYRMVGSVLHISGQIAQWEGSRPHLGRLGAEIATPDGIKAAELCALNILAWLSQATKDDADRVDCCLRLGGFVASTPEFTEQSQVISGASNLIVDVFGERGRHTRTAVGVASLPFGVAVEIDAQFVLR